MTAQMLLTDFRSRGISIAPDGERLVVEPTSRLTDKDREAIKTLKRDLLAALTPRPEILEVAMRAVPDTTFLYRGARDIAPMEFPLCPQCQSRRYWLATEGKVVCSKCGVVRFEIVAMEFRSIQ